VRRLLIIALALVASLGIISSASASSRDRNNDRLPDRWERAHHLSLKVKQAKRDQDRDGLNNRGEFRAKTNPRDHDTDDDGVEDGDENAGTIKSFEDGVLTITLAASGELAAKVDDDTEIECHSSGDHMARTSHDEGDDEDNSGPGGGDDEHGNGEHGDDDGPNHDADDDHGDDVHDHGEDHACGADALKAGTKVHEAELEITSKGKRWEELELLRA
jgi:hypothetical protein